MSPDCSVWSPTSKVVPQLVSAGRKAVVSLLSYPVSGGQSRSERTYQRQLSLTVALPQINLLAGIHGSR